MKTPQPDSPDELDEILDKHGAQPGELTYSLKQAINEYYTNKFLEARIDEVQGLKALYADISLDYPPEKRGKAFSDVTFDRIAELRQAINSRTRSVTMTNLKEERNNK